jgi:hypothetical protein
MLNPISVFSRLNLKTIKAEQLKAESVIMRDCKFPVMLSIFLNEKSPLAESGLEPKIWVNYVRITLASKDFKERLTLDLNLTFKNNQEEVTHENLVIAEVKQSRAGQSAFNKLMKEHHIRRGSISKYCFGIASMFRDLRANNFKEQIKKITQTTYATAAGYK